MHDQLASALKRLGAPYAEIRLEQREYTYIAFQGDQLATVDLTVDMGGIARALSPQGNWGVVTFTQNDDLRAHVRDAVRLASHGSSRKPVRLAPVDPVIAHVPANLSMDFRAIPLAEKTRLLSEYNDLMLRFDPRIETTTSTYLDTFVTIDYANTDGAHIHQERPLIDLHLEAVASDNETVQRGEKSLALSRGYEALIDRHDLARAAAQQAVDLLSSQPVRGGRFTVVMDPILAGLFAHEAIGHLSEADFISENPRAREMMALGRQFGPSPLSIYDDGHLLGLRGSIAYDDEGVPSQRNWLIRNGVLVGRLHSRETAALMDEQPTGNARATSYRYPPIVRMTNTAIAPADGGTLDDLIRDVDLGVYACDWSAGETALEDFTFVAKYGYMIRGGALAESVRAITLTGNVFKTLQNIEAIGSDFAWDESSGDCGKGQDGLAAGDGGPHIRVRDVLVGGQ